MYSLVVPVLLGEEDFVFAGLAPAAAAALLAFLRRRHFLGVLLLDRVLTEPEGTRFDKRVCFELKFEVSST
jgi:hypothetical protein